VEAALARTRAERGIRAPWVPVSGAADPEAFASRTIEALAGSLGRWADRDEALAVAEAPADPLGMARALEAWAGGHGAAIAWDAVDRLAHGPWLAPFFQGLVD